MQLLYLSSRDLLRPSVKRPEGRLTLIAATVTPAASRIGVAMPY